MHSVGSARQLQRLLGRIGEGQLEGISVHQRLLNAQSVAALRAVADLIMTWPVNHPDRAEELLRLGVDGLITDDANRLTTAALLRATS